MKQSSFRLACSAALRLALAFAAVAPVTCQNEAEPYFSLSSSRTYGSSEKPQIMLSAYGVPALKIRVYRVNDPVEFARKMEDLHSFGGRAPRRAGKLSVIERFHNWKRGVRRDIRLRLREQFSESPSAHLFPAEKDRRAAGISPARFADVPVLNPEQLVLSFTQAVSSSNRWDSQTVGIPVKTKGLFLVEATGAGMSAYTILSVTDAVLLTKTGGKGALGYFVDRESGEPIAASPVSAVAGKSAAIMRPTDGDGVVDLTPALAKPADIKLVARRGEDIAFSSIDEWNFSGRARNLTGLVYTDRPVYRPGDAVHFRGLLRLREAVGYSTPSGQDVSVQITDAEGKPVYQKNLSSNKNGVVHGEFVLSKESALGNFYFEAKMGDNSVSGSFEVQEYKKPEYEVRVTPSQTRVLQGAKVAVTVDARYYFGEPVKGAKVAYSFYRSRWWNSMWYRDEDESEEGNSEARNDNGPAGEEVGNGQGTLDDDGKLAINLPTSLSEEADDFTYRVEARVTDAAGREIAGSGYVTATYGSFAVNISPNRYFFEAGGTGSFKVEARDYDNHPISTPVQITLETWDWNRGRRERNTEIISTTRGATGSDGAQNIDVAIPRGRNIYHAVVSARTPEGRLVRASTYVWVSGASQTSIFDGEEGQTLRLVPEKKSYRPGETARILAVGVPDKMPVLLTVEGRDIRSHKLVRAQGSTAVFEYAVTADDEPGFYVSAQFVRRGKLFSGAKLVKVPPEEHKLNFQITTDKPTYLPGKTARYQLVALTSDGKPAANADLSLGVVDEAIYAVRPDTTPDLLKLFYGREYNSVYTQTSLSYYFTGEAGRRRMQLAQLRAPSALAQLKPEMPPRPKVRKYFPDTAFWAADLTTDSQGRAEASVPFPDSLTTWRATVRGAEGNRFGSATLKTIVRKNLILRLAVPRFFVQGDQVTVSGIVHNYLATGKRAKLNIKLAGLELVGTPAEASVDIPSREEAKVEWRVRAERGVRHATVTAEALTDEESDALEVELPVNPPGVPVRQAKGGTILNSGARGVSFTYPADAVDGSRSLSIRLTPSIAGSIFGALDYLTSFPYGCVEQTMSSFLPNLMVTKAVSELHLKSPGDPAVLAQKTQAGIDRLYSFQHDDGGWGWWQTDESHPFMTAYVVAGLSQAAGFGITVEKERIERGAQWTARALASDKTLEADLRAYMLYSLALAGKPDGAAANAAYSSRRDLSPYGLAILGLAFESVGDSRAKAIADQLAASAKLNELEAWWPAERDAMLDFSADVSPEATAFAVKLLSHQRPNDPLLPKAALWLVNHRNEGYWWSSSKQTAMVIYGLMDYLKAGRELDPDFTATVKVNGAEVTSHRFRSAGLLDEAVVTLPEEKLDRTGNKVEVAISGSGRVYWSTSAVHYSDAARAEKKGAVALNVLRDYFRLNRAAEGDHFVYDLAPLTGTVAPGDTLAVRLTVTGTDWRYLLVEDPIPAGTEFIERDNLYQIRNQPPWWRYWFTRRELHDDRMAIFQTYFNEGQQQYFYLLKVVNPGIFHVSPARVSPMYQPGTEATTESRSLEVNP